MDRVVYFCYGERATGIIRSQAVDVVRTISSLGLSAGLAVAVPMRERSATMCAFRQLVPDAQLFSALPTRAQGILGWAEVARVGSALHRARPSAVICRNAVATSLVLRARRLLGAKFSVCLDGRGASAAEQQEFQLHPAFRLAAIEAMERQSVLEANARLAVTDQLVAYWRERYGYSDDRHVVIPTTLEESALASPPDEFRRVEMRTRLGIAPEVPVFAYAGSNAGWQGLDDLLDQVELGLRLVPSAHFLFLTDPSERLEGLQASSAGRLTCRRVAPTEVQAWLSAADYGMLLRSPSVTNRVAFPTKYAEYLAAGLRVVCRGVPGVEDHVRLRNTGVVVDGEIPWRSLCALSAGDRQRSFSVAVDDFRKDAHLSSYRRLLDWLLPHGEARSSQLSSVGS